jgi:hypothetical protein
MDPGQACNLLMPIDISFFPLAEEFYSTTSSTWYQSGSFPWNNVGSDFHCLHSFGTLGHEVSRAYGLLEKLRAL